LDLLKGLREDITLLMYLHERLSAVSHYRLFQFVDLKIPAMIIAALFNVFQTLGLRLGY